MDKAHLDKETQKIIVGARQSPLSQAQVKEIHSELRKHYPKVEFDVKLVATYGDKDKTTSLRTLDKTDFFTREVDALVLNGTCRIGIHSAKDLPEPLTEGLLLIALTLGVDSSDALVLRKQGDLKAGAIVATSSERREEAVRKLHAGIKFVDIRGTIGERLEKLSSGQVDGVVIAEAALIRLGLTHMNRISLPGPTVPHQGQLAITARADDREMHALFACLDTRRQY